MRTIRSERKRRVVGPSLRSVIAAARKSPYITVSVVLATGRTPSRISRIGYPTCVQCGSAKNPTTFRYCSVCAKQRSEERALRLGYVRKNPVCSKCGQESATVNQSYCRPCAREYERARNREDPSKNRAKANNRRSRIRSACGTFSKTEWKALLKRLGEKCFYCGNKSKELTADHVVPLDAGGCNFIYNIRPACRSCNSRKRTKILDDVQFSLFDKIA